MKHNMGQLNNLFMYFSNKETIDKLISVKKPCILRYAKKKKKKKKKNWKFSDPFLIWYLKLKSSM